MRIGHGTHGSVHAISKNEVRKDFQERYIFIREAAALKRLSGHPNIIELIEVKNMSIILKRYPATLAHSKNIPSVLYQLLCALKFAAEHGIMHRDIKPANILVSGDNIILADWGLARYIDVADNELFTQCVITENFKPPYIDHNGPRLRYDHRADVWSIAKVGAYLLTYDYNALELSDLPSTCNETLYSFIEYVFTQNPNIDDALSHKLFSEKPENVIINKPIQIYHKSKSALDFLLTKSKNMLIVTTAMRIIDISNLQDFTKLKHAALLIAECLYSDVIIPKTKMPIITHILNTTDVYTDTFYLQILKLNKQLMKKYNIEIKVPNDLIIEILSLDVLKTADCKTLAAAALTIAWGRGIDESVLSEFGVSIQYVEYLCGLLDE